MPKRTLTKKDVDQIVALYTAPAEDGTWNGVYIIAKQMGVSSTTVQNYLRKRGIPMRSSKETHAHGKRCKPIKNLPVGDPPQCACGCGQLVNWYQRKNRWYKYVQGHYHPHHRGRIREEYKDPVWLRREYIEQSRSSNDIATQIGVSSSTIRRWLRKAGIAIRSQSESLHLSGAVARENNPAWNGGIAAWDYSPNWKSLCKMIKDRDEWTCQICGDCRKHWETDLHVHHIDGNKRNDHPWNLISLCSSCHHPIHGDEMIRGQLSIIARQRTTDVQKYL